MGHALAEGFAYLALIGDLSYQSVISGDYPFAPSLGLSTTLFFWARL